MRIYLIGAGAVAGTHAEASRKFPDPEEKELFIADPRPEALAAMLERFPEAVGYGDAAAMLADEARPDDMVIVATPPFTHYELSRKALESGRHTLCEKPLAMNAEEARQLLQLAKRQGRMLGCCSSRFRKLEKFERAKQLLRSGAIGDPYQVSFVQRIQRARSGIEHQPASRWFLDRTKNGGGCLMDWGSYDFLVLNDLLEPERVEVLSAWTARAVTKFDPPDVVNDVETHVGAAMRYHLANGTTVNVRYERSSCMHGRNDSSMEVEGTTGAIEWSPYEHHRIFHRYDREGKVVVEEQDCSNSEFENVMDNPLRFFVGAIRGDAKSALLDEQAVFNFICMQAIYDCAGSGEKQTINKQSY